MLHNGIRIGLQWNGMQTYHRLCKETVDRLLTVLDVNVTDSLQTYTIELYGIILQVNCVLIKILFLCRPSFSVFIL